MLPFSNNGAQKIFGFLLGMYGLVFLALGISFTKFIDLGFFRITYTTFGLIITFIGLYYFAESAFRD